MGVAERRLREKKLRRSSIIDAAEKVFFERGVETATMDAVAEAAELSKGLLYFYFKNKDDLAHAIAHRGLDVLEQTFHTALRSHDCGLDQVRAIGEAYVVFSREYEDYFRIMSWAQERQMSPILPGSHAEACQEQGDQCIMLTAQAIQNGIADRSIRAELNPVETAITIWAQLHGVIQIAALKGISEMHMVDADRLLKSSIDLVGYGLQQS